MPVIDLRVRFGLPNVDLNRDIPIVAVSTGNGALGLIVDDVDDLVGVTQAQITLNESSAFPYINSIARLENGLLQIVDTAKLASMTVA